jgi:hypothetical protein
LRIPARPIVFLAVAAITFDLSCSAHRPPRETPDRERAFGVYRGWADRDGDGPRRFRVLLHAALPDRIHAELLPPVGSAFLIIDGGGGRLSIASPRERIAYVGEPGADTLEGVLGVPVTLEGLVRALLLGEGIGADVTVERSPESGPGLPRRIELRSGSRRFGIELKEIKERGSRDERIGTGAPPPGVLTRPLEELGAQGTGEALIDVEPREP